MGCVASRPGPLNARSSKTGADDWGVGPVLSAGGGDNDPSARHRTPPNQKCSMAEVLLQIHALQEELAPSALPGVCPLLEMSRAADLLAARLGADAAAIWMFTGHAPTQTVLMASAGDAAAALGGDAVREVHYSGAFAMPAAGAPARSHAAAAPLPPTFGAPCALAVDDALAPTAPRGVQAFAAATGLRSFTQAVVGPPGAPTGALLLASRAPGAFDDADWGVWMRAATLSLLQHMSSPDVAQVAAASAQIAGAPDAQSAILELLRCTRRYAAKALGGRVDARLALLLPPPSSMSVPSEGTAGASSAAAAADALLFEQAPPPPRVAAALAAGGGGVAPHGVRSDSAWKPGALSGSLGSCVGSLLGAANGLIISRLDLSNTLLSCAVSQRQARFVRDCAAYMQGCHAMARDIFTRGSGCVSSIVVVPLVPGSDEGGANCGPPLGGLYFALDAPCEFDEARGLLLGFTFWAARALRARIGPADLAAIELEATATHGACCRRGSRELNDNGARSASDAGGVASGPLVLCAGPCPTPARLNTEAMVQVLQNELRSNARLSADMSRPGNPTREVWLDLAAPLGRGGFGAVYKGWWASAPVAVKVIPARSDAREAMRGAVEMAVLSSVRHPSVVQVFTCLTDMVAAAPASAPLSAAGPQSCDGSCELPTCATSRSRMGPARPRLFAAAPAMAHSAPLALRSGGSFSFSGAMGAPPGAVRYRQLAPGEEEDGSNELGGAAGACSMLVMELCDRGTLRDAVRAGAFHSRLPGGAVGVDCVGVLAVLADVARALEYLHSMGLVHGDVKMDNVLLKTDPLHPRGFVPKLSDFGLAKILSMEGSLPNVDGAGTISHLAPELLQPGAPITPAVDVYAFSVFMWELYSARRALDGIPAERVRDLVSRGLARPAFPPGAPPALAALADACSAADPALRPPFAEVAARLEAVAAEYAAAAAAVAAACPNGGAALGAAAPPPPAFQFAFAAQPRGSSNGSPRGRNALAPAGLPPSHTPPMNAA